jgi:DHA3 family tetracycline resistance protein-like MFS transporter
LTLLTIPKLAPIPVYLMMIGAASAFGLTHSTISSIYRIVEAGLNPLQLVLVGTALEASAFLFEVPTGVVADVYSRKLSMIIGFLFLGAGFLLEGLFPLFGVIIAAQLIAGLGYTFASGAEQAWIADEMEDRPVGRIFLRGAQMREVGALLGIGLGVALGSFALALPLIVGGALTMALAIFLIIVMPENGFRPAPRSERQSWKAMGQTAMGGLRAVRMRPVLGIILAVAIIYGAASEPIDRLFPKHLIDNFTFPTAISFELVVWFGIIGAASRILGIGITEVIRRSFDVDNARIAVRTLFMVNVVYIVGMVAVALTGSFALVVTMFLVVGMMRRVIDPVLDAWINQNIDSRVRATVFSMMGQGDAIGQIAFGPVMGALATITTIRVALTGVAAMLVPPLFLYLLAGRKGGEDEAENTT